MKENAIESIYRKLCLLSVFIGMKDREPIKGFFTYCESADFEERAKNYARFVSDIYTFGNGNLSDLVARVAYEDENIYIKSVAKGKKVTQCIEKQVQKELAALSQFASLTTSDFAKDMGVDEEILPAFDSFNADMGALFAARMQNIEKYGYGIFSASGMFRLSDERQIEPIVSADKIRMDSFIGYEEERAKVVANTRAFVEGRPAANTLLCGDAGTGKSSTVKAVANAFFDEGVRLIELRKDQLSFLPQVMGKISGNPLKFIIFIDDLSFNQNDDNFSMLKAALEGSASAKADNAVIYATSNRRHIIKESFGDREGDDVHRNDTLQETLSLSERFGLTVLFSKPNKQLYLEIIHQLAKRHDIQMEEKELDTLAEAFALRKGSRSARCAEQFIESLL